ncbi:phage tail protein [Saccharothrix syringae]|nr:hypothetical protein [Saccharothrix syringae]
MTEPDRGVEHRSEGTRVGRAADPEPALRPDGPPATVRAQPRRLTAAEALAVQRLAGNRALSGALAPARPKTEPPTVETAPAETDGPAPSDAPTTPDIAPGGPPPGTGGSAGAGGSPRGAGDRVGAGGPGCGPSVAEPALLPVQRGLPDSVAGLAGNARNRVLSTIGEWARRMPGYGVLCLALGRDVITRQPVARDATAVVGALVGLVPGGAALWQNLQRSGAVARAAEWLSGEVARLGLTWEWVRGLFSRAWDALGVTDLLNPGAAWARLSGVLAEPIQRLRTFAGGAASKLMEFVFEGVLTSAGGVGAQVMGVVRRAGDVIGTIVRDPVAFAGNLVAAVRGGLGQFAGNILGHLRTGLFGWLTGALRGAVALPARFDFAGILSLVLNLLGLTWDWLRGRLVRTLGEPTVRAVETAVDWVRTMVVGGIAAVAHRLTDMASGLVDTVIGGIRDWVANSVVGAAITRLVSLFNPAGAVIQAIIAVYNTIRFFIERAQQLGALAESVFGSLAVIAAGSLDAARNAVEQALGRAVPVVLGFLARLLGLGDVATPVRTVVNRVRSLVDRAVDRVVGWVVGAARRVGGGLRQAGQAAARRVVDWFTLRKSFTGSDGASHSLFWRGRGRGATLTVASTPTPVDTVLRNVAPVIRTSHPNLLGALQAAEAKQRQVAALKTTVEQAGAAGRQPADVDRLNTAMRELATLMVPLVPVAFPATAATTPGSFPSWVQPNKLVKLTRENRVAQVTGFDTTTPALPKVGYVVLRPRLREDSPWQPRQGGRVAGSTEWVTPGPVKDFWQEYTQNPRNYFMGPTPSKNGPIGELVKARMTREGKLVNGVVRYGRDANGDPLPAGQYTSYPLSACVMGHVIDAVTWWNSNGRFVGAQADAVRRFMTDPINYELEPGSVNSLRGARLGTRYLPPTV